MMTERERRQRRALIESAWTLEHQTAARDETADERQRRTTDERNARRKRRRFERAAYPAHDRTRAYDLMYTR